MTSQELSEEVTIQLELIDNTIQLLVSLRNSFSSKMPTPHEKTALASYMAQFYNGVENILKRISRYYNVPLPVGELWHVQLVKNFCEPPEHPLPLLFNKELESSLSMYRRFRHLFFHGYSFQLEWERMKEGAESIDKVYLEVKQMITQFLQQIN